MKNLIIILSITAIIFVGCENVAKKQAEHVRHIELEGEPNFRDIGGYQTDDGKTVKWGEVYRSGKLSQLTEGDVWILDSLNIQTVVNFLDPTEIAQTGLDKLPATTTVLLDPINAEGDWIGILMDARETGDFSRIGTELNPEFHRMLVNEAKDQYAILIREIIDQENRPLVFHCSHGIHRTGTAAAILLWSLGVSWDTIRADYLLSNDFRAEEIEKRLEYFKNLSATKQDIQPEEVDMTNIEAFYILQGFYVDAVKETIEEDYGTIENYLSDGLGLTAAEVIKLKQQLLQ
jgi:protein-tyrosine phosphatase